MGDVPAGTLQLSFASDPFAVRHALEQARVQWVAWALSDDACATAEQVLAEVLNNVVEHAHRQDPTGAVVMTNRCQAARLYCEVRDDGIAMPDGALPQGKLAAVAGGLDDLPEGGFGWFLIRSLTEDLTYRRDGDCNRRAFHSAGEG